MDRIECRLLCHSNAPHLQQIYAGFGMLRRKGLIRLREELIRPARTESEESSRDGCQAHLPVLVNGTVLACFDTRDGPEISEADLSAAHIYFKRSYVEPYVAGLPQREKVRPLGLNYLVHDDYPDLNALKRRLFLRPGRCRMDGLMAALALDRFLGRLYFPRAGNCSQHPDLAAPPRILFIAAALDPEQAEGIEQRREREALNTLRAECIRVLKQEFGELFRGGFRRSRYSEKDYGELLVPDDYGTGGKSYRHLLRDCPIVVANPHRRGTIGWRFAEYVAHAKAIVSEPLRCRIPGAFDPETHYLAFDSAETCAAAVARLVEDRNLRSSLMLNNYRYYLAYLRPDALVWNALAEVVTVP